MPERELGAALLRLARASIGEKLGKPLPVDARHARLHEPGATFVTLTQQGQLRGCIGSLEAHRPLAQDVRENAQPAALRDPRFSPLAAEEFEFTSAADGTRIACVEWRARGKPRATVAIAHGAAEHGRRYARFAAALTAAGYATLAIDHRVFRVHRALAA